MTHSPPAKSMAGIPAFNINGILTKYLGISDKTLGIPPEYAFILFLLAACFPLYMIAHLAHRSQTKYEFLSPGLRAITGKFGAGKTYLMTWAALACMKQGVRAVKGYDRRAITGKEIIYNAKGKPGTRSVYANYAIKGQSDPREFLKQPLMFYPDGEQDRRLHNWEEILALPWGAVICLDEGHLWWASYDWRVSGGLEKWVSQIRKNGHSFYFTSQDWAFVSMRLRRLVQTLWEGQGILGGHLYCSFTPGGFEQFQAKRTKSLRVARMYIRRKRRIMHSYNTAEVVESVPPPRAEVVNATPRSKEIADANSVHEPEYVDFSAQMPPPPPTPITAAKVVPRIGRHYKTG